MVDVRKIAEPVLPQAYEGGGVRDGDEQHHQALEGLPLADATDQKIGHHEEEQFLRRREASAGVEGEPGGGEREDGVERERNVVGKRGRAHFVAGHEVKPDKDEDRQHDLGCRDRDLDEGEPEGDSVDEGGLPVQKARPDAGKKPAPGFGGHARVAYQRSKGRGRKEPGLGQISEV